MAISTVKTETLKSKIKLLEQELKISENKKEMFVSTISHELRTPLSIIKGYMDLASEGILGEIPEHLEEAIYKSKEGADKLHRLMENLLDFSRLESGKLPFKLKSVSIPSVISKSISAFSAALKKKNLDVRVKIDDNIPLILADEDKLIKVLGNLIHNAIKFSYEGGKILIEASKANNFKYKSLKKDESGNNLEYVFISVADTGIGLPKNKQKEIFEGFQQEENYLTNKKEGLGIGLSICKRLIEEHGGELWAESANGKGSKFVFLLPADPLKKKILDDAG